MSDVVAEAAEAALAGKLIVIPTDTVYGIGTRPDSADATAALFAAKGRPRDLTLPVLVPSVGTARSIATFDERADILVARFWPGALTIVLPRSATSAAWDLGEATATVGVRMPRHPLARAILDAAGPLAVTSANRSGEPTPALGEDVVGVFGDAVAVYVLEDVPLSGEASTVVDLSEGGVQVVREGALTEAEICRAMESLPVPPRRV